MAQEDSRRTLVAKARIKSNTSPCGICGGQRVQCGRRRSTYASS
jgi:hypothetical protein